MSDDAGSAKSLPRRFYKQTGVEPADTTDGEAGFAVTLDGRPIRTPAKAGLHVPTRPLAEAIAQEWNEQQEQIQPDSMPLTQIAGTAIDRVGPEIDQVRADVLGYASTDLLCYRAEQPEDLVKEQAAVWQPILDWLARAYDAPLVATKGVIAISQPEESLSALKRVVDRQSQFELTALSILAGCLGSLGLALAVKDGERTPDQAWRTAFLDEIWQAERWGEDQEATDRRFAILKEIENASRFIALARP